MNSRRNPKNINPLLALALSAGLGLAAGCDDADATRGEGTLGVAIWGEEFIETGIPASEFADGYGVTFDSFLINVGEIAVAREEGLTPYTLFGDYLPVALAALLTLFLLRDKKKAAPAWSGHDFPTGI